MGKLFGKPVTPLYLESYIAKLLTSKLSICHTQLILTRPYSGTVEIFNY